MADVRLHQIARHHTDLAAAERFYTEVVGLRRIATVDPPGLLFLDLGGTRLLVEQGDPAGNSILYLGVDDLDAAWAELVERGADEVHGPHRINTDTDGLFGPAGHEEWMAFFRDPDGGHLALASQRPAAGG